MVGLLARGMAGGRVGGCGGWDTPAPVPWLSPVPMQRGCGLWGGFTPALPNVMCILGSSCLSAPLSAKLQSQSRRQGLLCCPGPLLSLLGWPVPSVSQPFPAPTCSCSLGLCLTPRGRTRGLDLLESGPLSPYPAQLELCLHSLLSQQHSWRSLLFPLTSSDIWLAGKAWWHEFEWGTGWANLANPDWDTES